MPLHTESERHLEQIRHHVVVKRLLVVCFLLCSNQEEWKTLNAAPRVDDCHTRCLVDQLQTKWPSCHQGQRHLDGMLASHRSPTSGPVDRTAKRMWRLNRLMNNRPPPCFMSLPVTFTEKLLSVFGKVPYSWIRNVQPGPINIMELLKIIYFKLFS